MTVRRNTFYNLFGTLLPTIVTLLTVPIYLRLIGVDRYGILVIAWVILGYFGVFDLGLGRATAQRIASMKHAEPSKRAEVFWTALALNTVFGVIGGLFLWPVATYYFTNYLHVPKQLQLEILAAVPWLVFAMPVSTVSGVLSGSLQGRERFLALNVCSVLESTLSQLFPLAVVWLHGPNIAWLVPATLLGRVLVFLIMFVQCYLHLPLTKVVTMNRNLLVPLFRFGGWVTVTSFIGPLLSTFDRFIIGSIAGPKAVTYYTVPFSIISRVSTIPGSLANTLFPRFSATSEEERLRLMKEAIQVLSVIMTPLIIIGILIMEPFLTWWVGQDVAKNSAFIGEILAIGFWFNGLATIPFARLQAEERPDLIAKCHLAEILPYLAFMAIALHTWGVLGAAFGWSLRATVDAILLFWASRTVPRSLMIHLPPLLFMGLASIAVFAFPLTSVFRWIAGTGALLGCLGWAWRSAPTSVRKFVVDGTNILHKAFSCHEKTVKHKID